MVKMNVHAAKTNLSRLLAQVEAGEDVVIARSGMPVARLVRVQKPNKRHFDAIKDKIKVDERFFDLLPEEKVAEWPG